MPIYIYQNPKTGKIKEIVQTMKESHVYSEKGVEWKRVFSNPQARIDGSYDCWSSSDFTNKTRNKKGSLGDLWNLSQELSQKRERSGGIDPVKEKSISDYESAYKRSHPETRKRQLKKISNKLGLNIEE